MAIYLNEYCNRYKYNFFSNIAGGESFREIINNDKYTFLSCNFAIGEIFKHKEKIVKVSKNTEEEVLRLFFKILKDIHFINEKVITADNKQQAYNFRTPDPRDFNLIPFYGPYRNL